MTAPHTIRTARLLGSPVEPTDLDYIVAIDADPDVQRTLPRKIVSAAESKARLERWLAHWREHGLGFWIFRDHGGEIVGHAGLFQSKRQPGSLELGYVVRTPYWGHGYASEMSRELVAIAFEVLRVPSIVAISVPENAASRRVMEKCGLAFEAEYEHPEEGPSVLYRAKRAAWLRGRSA